MIPVRKVEDVGRFVTLELVQNPRRQRTSVRPQRLRRFQSNQVWVIRHVRLPPAPNDGVALSHQKTVARFQWRSGFHRSGRTIESEDRLATAVHDVENQTAPTPIRVLGLEHLEVR